MGVEYRHEREEQCETGWKVFELEILRYIVPIGATKKWYIKKTERDEIG